MSVMNEQGINAQLRARAASKRGSYCVYPEGEARFVDASVNWDDLKAFLHGWGALVIPPTRDYTMNDQMVSLGDGRNVPLYDIECDLIPGFQHAHLLVRGNTTLPVLAATQRGFRHDMKVWASNEHLPCDPLVWKLAGVFPSMKQYPFLTAYILEHEEIYRPMFEKNWTPTSEPMIEVPFIGLMNIDKVRENLSNGEQ